MAKDFTKIGRGFPSANPVGLTRLDPPNAQSRRVVVLAILMSAGGFLVAGIWLVLGMPSPIPNEYSLFAGTALMVSAFADLFAIKLIKRRWARSQGQ